MRGGLVWQGLADIPSRIRHDVCEADPLLGSDACFARCASADELAQALARARALPDADYAAWTRRQREFAATIYAPLDEAQLLAQPQDQTPASSRRPDDAAGGLAREAIALMGAAAGSA